MVNKNSIVYLYGFSTMLESNLQNFKKIVEIQIEQNHNISIVFVHDGVIGTSQKSKITPLMKELLKLPLKFYVIIPDLKARGIDTKNLQTKINGIDYDDLVDILAETPKIVSWV